MTTILFPTRGGQDSYPNQDRVIALADEKDADLIFMYVADVRFLNLVMSPVLVDMEAEIAEMGEFMLAMAQERAEKAGVEADILVYSGVFRDALKEAIGETGADMVILGAPTQSTGITNPSYRRSLIRELIEQTGVEVLVVDEGKLVNHWGPKDLPEEAK